MYTGSVLDLADDGARIDIEHLDLGSVGNVQAARAFIDGEIVPTALAGDRNFLGDVVPPGGLG